MYQRRRDDPLRGLDHAARKRVRRAVRHGVAVHDPREAPAAAAYADVVAARETPIPFGFPVILALLAAAGVAVELGWLAPVWLLPFAMAVVVRPLETRIVARAKAAAAANRELAVATGVQLTDRPTPKPAWHGVTPWGIAAVMLFLSVAHAGVRAFDGGDLQGVPPASAEPTSAPVDNVAWYANAEARCRQAATVIADLPARNAKAFRAWRFEVRTRTAAAIESGAGLSPDRVNGALAHLDRALRHEQLAVTLERRGRSAASEWKAASYEARVSTALLRAFGVHSCSRAFG
jgi:hypothetical protein